jgi:hypothetical protein
LKTKDIGLILKEPGFALKVSLCSYIFIKKGAVNRTCRGNNLKTSMIGSENKQ